MRKFWPLFLLLLWTSACNLPSLQKALTPTVDLTPLAATLAAVQRERATSGHMRAPATPAPPTATQPKEHPAESASPNPTAGTCLMAAAPPHIDITIPDGTMLRPGQAFTKIWRLRNAGTCPWTPDFAVVWFAGARLGAPYTVPLGREVPPGATVDISVDMLAPLEPGRYTAYWKLRAADGVIFGLGPGGGAPFWVSILVGNASPTPPPSPTITPTPPIHGRLSVTLAPEEALDLDSLTLSADAPDVRYRLDAQGAHHLEPLGKVRLGIFGMVPPSLADCRKTHQTTLPVPLDLLTPGTYLCYTTEEGRPGRLRYGGLSAEGDRITLNCLTWEAP